MGWKSNEEGSIRVHGIGCSLRFEDGVVMGLKVQG